VFPRLIIALHILTFTPQARRGGFNMIWPIVIVNGTKPELDIISDDANIVLSINYEHDVAVTMGDWVYHKTSPNDCQDEGQMRIVVNAYVVRLTRRMLA
jgi:hypothetical protein